MSTVRTEPFLARLFRTVRGVVAEVRQMPVMQTVNSAVRRVPAWLIYLLAPLPAVWWFYLGVTGGLGPEPIKELEHRYGEFALQLLILGLAVTPLRTFTGLMLIKFRRAIGLMAFFYVVLHLLVWLVLDLNIMWGQIWADILKRPYITIGMAGFATLIPLAATSNNLSLRKMGPVKWRKLHKLTYLAVLLGAVHWVLLVKGWQIEPILYLTAIIGLLAVRLVPQRKRVAA